MNMVSRVMDILAERAAAIIGAVFASRLETLATMQQTEHQNELEDRARQLEKEGKPHLAATLRSRAANINPDDPGAQGQCIIRHLQEEDSGQALLCRDSQQTILREDSGGASNSDHATPLTNSDRAANNHQPRRRKTDTQRRRRSASRE